VTGPETPAGTTAQRTTTGRTTTERTTMSTPSTARRIHPLNTLFGLLFLAAAGSWAAHDQDLLDGDELGRVVAVGLIVLGALGVVATVLVSRSGRSPRTDVGTSTGGSTPPDERDTPDEPAS
jgi:hypothetical protein